MEREVKRELKGRMSKLIIWKNEWLLNCTGIMEMETSRRVWWRCFWMGRKCRGWCVRRGRRRTGITRSRSRVRHSSVCLRAGGGCCGREETGPASFLLRHCRDGVLEWSCVCLFRSYSCPIGYSVFVRYSWKFHLCGRWSFFWTFRRCGWASSSSCWDIRRP